MRLEEFAQLLGKSLEEAEEILKGEDVISINLTEKRGSNSKENFKMEIIK